MLGLIFGAMMLYGFIELMNVREPLSSRDCYGHAAVTRYRARKLTRAAVVWSLGFVGAVALAVRALLGALLN